MKATIQTLKVRLVWAFKYVKQFSYVSGREMDVREPVGDLHIFEYTINVDGETVLNGLSFCGKSRYDISPLTADGEKRPPLLMCAECEKAWKADNRSPWRAWEEGRKVGAV